MLNTTPFLNYQDPKFCMYLYSGLAHSYDLGKLLRAQALEGHAGIPLYLCLPPASQTSEVVGGRHGKEVLLYTGCKVKWERGTSLHKLPSHRNADVWGAPSWCFPESSAAWEKETLLNSTPLHDASSLLGPRCASSGREDPSWVPVWQVSLAMETTVTPPPHDCYSLLKPSITASRLQERRTIWRSVLQGSVVLSWWGKGAETS